MSDLTYIRPHIPIENLVNLVIAIYETALDEAEGRVSHWTHDLSPDEILCKRQEAIEFINECRLSFSDHLSAGTRIKLLSEVKQKAKHGKPPENLGRTMRHIEEYLAEVGQATVREIATVVGVTNPRATNIMKSRPKIFCTTGMRQIGESEWQTATLWGLVANHSTEVLLT